MASSWFIEFNRRFQVSVSAQTGRVLRYADAPYLEKTSKSAMYRNGRATGTEAAPQFTMLPPAMCFGYSNNWCLKNSHAQTASVGLQGSYFEWPDGLDVVGTEDRIELLFSPRSGKLVLFSRALDPVPRNDPLPPGCTKRRATITSIFPTRSFRRRSIVPSPPISRAIRRSTPA